MKSTNDNSTLDNIVIIGKGSKLYQNYLSLSNAKEYSTVDFQKPNFSAMDFELVIVFSLLTATDLDRLSERTNGTVIIVGSCAAISSVSFRFGYSRFKRSQLQFVESSCVTRFKYLIFGEFSPSKRSGLIFRSDIGSFWSDIACASSSDERVIRCFYVDGNSTFISNILSCIDHIFAPISSLVIKYVTSFSYGYSNAKNIKKRS
jgi:hypothetical protein